MLTTRGFNLAEVMVALSLITISLFALISMQAHSMQSQTDSRETHQASVVAGSLLAAAEAQLEADFEADVSRDMAPLVDNPEFEAAITIETPGVDLKKVKVEVRWKDGPGVARRGLETTVAKAYY